MLCVLFFFFFNDTATTEIYTLSLHDALPIFIEDSGAVMPVCAWVDGEYGISGVYLGVEAEIGREGVRRVVEGDLSERSEEHTSELQSRQYLVCRLLLEKKKTDRRLNTPVMHL